jgi:hypothetical protein
VKKKRSLHAESVASAATPRITLFYASAVLEMNHEHDQFPRSLSKMDQGQKVLILPVVSPLISTNASDNLRHAVTICCKMSGE